MISAIITCAGNGSRFGGNKLLELLAGKPIVVRTVGQFQQSKKVDEIIVVAKKDDISIYKRFFRKSNLKVRIVQGGSKRYISAYNGVKASKSDFVLIHDGARPLVPVWLIDNICDEVLKHYSVMAAFEPDTCVKKSFSFFPCRNESDNTCIEKNLSRAECWLGQTPHAFKKEIIINAYKKAMENNFDGMDDCEIVSKLGDRVKIVPGDKMNIKITVPSDLIIARHFFKTRKKDKDV